MSTSALIALIGGIAATVVGGVIALIMASSKKLGQKTTEAQLEAQRAKDAKVAGAVVAERVSRDDIADRLRKSEF